MSRNTPRRTTPRQSMEQYLAQQGLATPVVTAVEPIATTVAATRSRRTARAVFDPTKASIPIGGGKALSPRVSPPRTTSSRISPRRASPVKVADNYVLHVGLAYNKKANGKVFMPAQSTIAVITTKGQSPALPPKQRRGPCRDVSVNFQQALPKSMIDVVNNNRGKALVASFNFTDSGPVLTNITVKQPTTVTPLTNLDATDLQVPIDLID